MTMLDEFKEFWGEFVEVNTAMTCNDHSCCMAFLGKEDQVGQREILSANQTTKATKAHVSYRRIDGESFDVCVTW